MGKQRAAAGDMLSQQMLGLSRRLFAAAVIALFAIAGTVAVMYLVHDDTSRWVANSREIARHARTAYLVTIVSEDALQSIGPAKAGERAESRSRLRASIESLLPLMRLRDERAAHAEEIGRAENDWKAATAGAQKRRFGALRAQLAELVLAEDSRQAARQERQRNVIILATGVLFCEIIILLLVIGRMWRRLMSQTTEVLRQKNSIESQAEQLEVSNRELAAAITEKERARALAEEQAAEQTAICTAITEVFFVMDRDGRYHKIAPTNDDLLAKSREELLNKRVHEVLPGPVAALALSSISKALDTGQRVDVEYALDLRAGTVWFEGTVTPLGADRVLWVARDVSENKKAAEALKESEARFRHLVENSPQAVSLHAEGRMLYANPACAALLGFANHEDLVGAPLFRFVTRESAPRLVESLASLGRTATRGSTCECQFRKINDDTRLRAIEVTSVSVTYNGRAGVLSILHDVTERKQLEEQLAHQAFHDPLTNLANRVLFKDRVEHALQRAVRGGGSPSVLFIDLDNFKAVNDGLGHSAGDWLLIEVANRLTVCLRPADTVARLGGDEFAVLLDDGVADAEEVAERILLAFHAPFSVQGTDIVVTMSIGIASLGAHQGADDVLRNADLALYRAKGEGKACVASFEPEMRVAAIRRVELETELRRAINGEPGAGNLVIHYQPISRLSTGKIFGLEALVRWQHPERGLLEPLDFISLAEETGLIVPLGRWVLHEACRQTREWQMRFAHMLKGSGVSLMVGVNLSGRHLSQPGIEIDVAMALRGSGLTPSHLVLELTESMLVHDNRATLERLQALKALGVRLSIDDFGTGYSSLAYLERFPVDSLKMDRSFIAGLGSDETKAPLAEAVIGLGRILGLRVVAEGIETREQWDRLRALGCGLGQGYYIARPVPAAQFEQLIATSASVAQGLGNDRLPRTGKKGRKTPVSSAQATT